MTSEGVVKTHVFSGLRKYPTTWLPRTTFMFETTLAPSVSIYSSPYSTNMERQRSRFKELLAASRPKDLDVCGRTRRDRPVT